VFYKPLDFHSKLSERYGPARYGVYVLKKKGDPTWVDLGAASSIDAEIKKLRTALSNRKSSDVTQIARTLDEAVMRPIRKLTGDARMILISPDGALNLVPFGTLVDEQNRYLIENYSFVYLSSGRDLLRITAPVRSRQGPVVVANPLFDLDDNTNPKTSAQPSGQTNASQGRSDLGNARFTPLSGTAEEAQALSTILVSATVLTKERATETALKQLKGPSVVHIATHGFFLQDTETQRGRERSLSRGLILGGESLSQLNLSSGQNPLLRSGLAFAGANTRRVNNADDGILSAYEASGLDLWGTKLVVLSACDTGVGEVRVGEGVYGLRRALVMAGAESQVTTLWQVDDAATRDLMVDYYTRLQKGEGRNDALRNAQLSMLKSANRSHPFYWASFIQVGQWRPLDQHLMPAESK
jgi:CHAT domain-containing protein